VATTLRGDVFDVLDDLPDVAEGVAHPAARTGLGPMADRPSIELPTEGGEMPPLVRVMLVVLGILAVIVGVIYLVEPIHSLPSFFPGYAAHQQGHHHIRGYAAIAVGIILLVIAAAAGRSRRRSY
jgi:NADH:ubiquinone oxidoreductase subunit 5 (subunit L)/multisubunit Na+/H+ antiporter MnhA subunit